MFSDKLAERIFDELMDGRSLVQICAADDMPNRRTVLRWMEKDEAFATKCARARTMQADLMDDKILELAENCTPESAPADRVKLAAYQWRASKLAPKKYGDKASVELSGKDGGPIEVAELSPLELARRIGFVFAKAERDMEGEANG
jgi:hypothetical protein